MGTHVTTNGEIQWNCLSCPVCPGLFLASSPFLLSSFALSCLPVQNCRRELNSQMTKKVTNRSTPPTQNPQTNCYIHKRCQISVFLKSITFLCHSVARHNTFFLLMFQWFGLQPSWLMVSCRLPLSLYSQFTVLPLHVLYH